MNFAWSNPLTGLREQTIQGTPERMLAEAKLELWNELQFIPLEDDPGEWTIHKQEPIGTVTVDGLAIDVERASTTSDLFAYANPETGERMVTKKLADAAPVIVEQLKRLQNQRDSKDCVIIYATWPECTVRRDDPRPEAPPPEEVPEAPADSRAGDAPDIHAKKRDLNNVIVLDDDTKVALTTAWALLDIASTLRELAAESRYPSFRKHAAALADFDSEDESTWNNENATRTATQTTQDKWQDERRAGSVPHEYEDGGPRNRCLRCYMVREHPIHQTQGNEK